MVNMLTYGRLLVQLDQSKDYEIGICCYSAKHTVLEQIDCSKSE